MGKTYQHSELLSTILPNVELAKIDAIELREAGNFKDSTWMTFYTALMPITDWLLTGILPHIRTDFFNAAVPNLLPQVPTLLFPESILTDPNTRLYKRGGGTPTVFGSSYPPARSMIESQASLTSKEYASRATILKQDGKKGYQATLSTGQVGFTAQFGRPARRASDVHEELQQLRNNFIVVSSFHTEASLCYIKNEKTRNALVKLFGKDFFSVQSPYQGSFKLPRKFTQYLAQSINLSPREFVASIMRELGVAEWAYSFGIEGYDDDPEAFTLYHMVDAYLEWLDDHVTTLELISKPVTRGEMNTVLNEAGERVVPVDLRDPVLATGSLSNQTRANIGLTIGNDEALAYTLNDYFIDSVLSNRSVTAHVLVDMPKSVAQFATQDEEVDEYYLIQILDKAQLELQDFQPYTSSTTDSPQELGSHSYGYFSYPSVYKTAEVLAKRTPAQSIGVNKNGLGLRPDGTIIYIPTKLNRLSKHREAVEAYFNEAQIDGRPRTIYLRDPFDIRGNYAVVGKAATERPRPTPTSLAPQPLYVDWGIGVMVGVDSNGAINKLMDVAHTTPLESRHLAAYGSAAIISIALSDSSGWAKSYTDVLFATKPNQINAITDPMSLLFKNLFVTYVSADDLKAFLVDHIKQIATLPSPDNHSSSVIALDDPTIDSLATRVLTALRSAAPAVTLAQACYSITYMIYTKMRVLYGDETDFPDTSLVDDHVDMYHNGHGEYTTLKDVAKWNTSSCILTRVLGWSILKIWAGVKGKLSELMKITSLAQAMHYYGTLAAVADALERNENLSLNLYDSYYQPPADYVPEALPGSREDYTSLPHQVRVDYHMSNMINEKINLRILHAQAGAGKTHNLLNDVMRQLAKKTVNRPLIICPNYLIKNYIEDAAYIYEGRLNVVPIDTAIKNYSPLLGDSETLNLEGILDMINNAPINTIFITSYTFLSSGASSAIDLPMGLEVHSVNPHVEMLLEAGFDYVGADESQELRNEGTTKWDECLTLFYRAKERVLATGTFLNTSPSDIPAQTVMLDPSIFGSHSNFFEYYAETEGTGKSARISRLKDSRRDELVFSLKRQLGYIQVKRKEWAALLPDRKDSYHIITLDPESGQWKIYQAILKQVLDEIKRILEKNKAISRQAEDGDGEAEESLDNLLRPYLQRLEMLLITPHLDKEYAALASSLDVKIDDEYISPAIQRAIRIMDSHINGIDLVKLPEGMTREDVIEDARDFMDLDSIVNLDKAKFIPGKDGKILVFCNYKTSVKAVYEALPADLKKQAIAYDAQLKDKHIFEFKNNPDKKILIGIQTSLATGHNFQFCTRLIRLEQVWSPGEVEQGESRLNRPDPKNANNNRSLLFYDWIVVDGTIQVTKLSRLISRMIVNTQIDEHGNPAYNDIPYMPLLVMNLRTIQQNCWFHSPFDQDLGKVTERSLLRYLEIKRDIDVIQKREFEQWRETYNGATKPVAVPSTDILEGSKLLANVPPIPGQVVANADKFSCVNVAKYETLMGSQDVDLVGLRCYTPEGDGEIVKMSGTKLHVLINHQKYSFDRLAVSIYMDPKYSHQDIIKSTKLKSVITISGEPYHAGKSTKNSKDDLVPMDDLYSKSVEFLKKSAETRVIKTTKKTRSPIPDSTSDEVDGSIEVYATNTNGALCLILAADDADLETKKAQRFLTSMDFHLEPECWYAEMPNYKTYEAVIEKFESKFNIPEAHLDLLYELRDAFSTGRRRLLNADHSTIKEIREYWLMDYKRALRKDPDVLMPMPCVQDGVLYLMMDSKLPSSLRAKRLRIPNVSWELDGGSWMKMYATKAECVADLRAVQERFIISNKDDLKAALKEIKITNRSKK